LRADIPDREEKMSDVGYRLTGFIQGYLDDTGLALHELCALAKVPLSGVDRFMKREEINFPVENLIQILNYIIKKRNKAKKRKEANGHLQAHT
jgi:predicted transcriptional regulator